MTEHFDITVTGNVMPESVDSNERVYVKPIYRKLKYDSKRDYAAFYD